MIKHLLKTLSVVFALLLPAAAANATCGTGTGTCFVTPGGGIWAVGTFSSSSGGTSCGCIPATGDALILDSLAGNVTSVAGSPSLVSFDASGTGGSGSPYTGTFTHTATINITITGNLWKLSPSMTYVLGSSTTSGWTFTSTSGPTLLTTAGKTVGNLTFNGAAGSFQFQDNVNSSGTLTLTNGTLDAATNNVNVNAIAFSSNNANTRTLNMGTGTWTFTPVNGATVWDLTTGTNMTLSAASSTITILQTGQTNSNITFQIGGSGCTCSYNVINVGASANARGLSFIGGITFSVQTLNLTAPNHIGFPNQTTTIANAVTWTGSSTNQIVATWSGAGGTISNNVNFNTNSTISWAYLSGIHNTGTGTVTCNSCFNGLNNTNITFGAFSGGGGVGIIGGN